MKNKRSYVRYSSTILVSNLIFSACDFLLVIKEKVRGKEKENIKKKKRKKEKRKLL